MRKQPNTDWLKFFQTGITTNHTLTFSNGSENSSSFTSLGYFNQQNSKDSDLTRFSVRNNVSGSSKDQKLTYSTAVSMNYSKNNQPTSIGTNGVNQNPLLSLSLPYLTPQDNPGPVVLAQSFILGYAPFILLTNYVLLWLLKKKLKFLLVLHHLIK
jgi:hypothetical protein